jgi:uncharacterized membrane protein YgdD (TMEM256/DUF423 family)
MNLSWIQLGSLFMFLAVGLGAFGSHLLRGKISDHYLDIYKTGVLYHFLHAIGIFIVAWLSTQSGDPKIQYAGICFMMGIILFSGSLYFLSVTEIKWLGAITPLGGLCFLAGWGLIFTSKYNLPF